MKVVKIRVKKCQDGVYSVTARTNEGVSVFNREKVGTRTEAMAVARYWRSQIKPGIARYIEVKR